jgi:hypothetical protein
MKIVNIKQLNIKIKKIEPFFFLDKDIERKIPFFFTIKEKKFK